MPKPIEKKPKSFTEFVQLIEERQAAVAPNPLWYRGCGQSSYTLLPSLYRHRTLRTSEQLAQLERNLLIHFRQRSIPFHSRDLSDDWSSLFFMQHYRVPTRLLDWTENPFIGLYFAAMSAAFEVKSDASLAFPSAAAVWVLDPVAWNRHTLRHQSFDGEILVPGDEALKGYQPSTTFATMNNAPVALYGAHNSPRIVAQRGVFTIFGKNTAAMEKTYSSDSYPTDSLIKVTLQRTYLPVLRAAILRYGVTESVIYPDLDGLASEIRRVFKFAN